MEAYLCTERTPAKTPVRGPAFMSVTNSTFTKGTSTARSHGLGASMPRRRTHRVAPSPLPTKPFGLPDADTPSQSMESLEAQENISARALAARLQRELGAALETVDRQALQIATLEGRATAQTAIELDAARIASTPWMTEAEAKEARGRVRRFKYIAGGPPAFTDDALAELLDEGVVAHNRRMANVLAESMAARESAAAAVAIEETRLADAAKVFKNPHAERLVREATRSFTQRAHKEMARLQFAVERLEAETAAAQRSCAASLRSLAAKMVAQRDALTATTLAELEMAEMASAGRLEPPAFLGLLWASLGCHRLPQAATGCRRLPQAATGCHGLPQAATGCHRLPQAATGCHGLPRAATGCHRLP